MDHADIYSLWAQLADRVSVLERRQNRLDDHVEHLLCVPVFDVSGNITSVRNMPKRWDECADEDNG